MVAVSSTGMLSGVSNQFRPVWPPNTVSLRLTRRQHANKLTRVMGKKLTPLESLISPDDIRRLHAPISEATGLPGAAYGSAFHEVERIRCFAAAGA